MEANGGSNNAYTTNDVTVYQDWFPKTQMELILDLEADRIASLNFDPKIVDSERGVVASERRTSIDANNAGVLYEQLWAAAYMAHPYKWPVVGWMSDIESWTMDDLKRFYSMGYSPSNATMVLVGDIKAEEAFALVEKHIGPLEARTPPEKVHTVEPPQMGEKRIVVRKFAQLPIVMMGYKIPQTNTPDYYALQVLDTILFSGESSRMYRSIVDQQQLALDVSSDRNYAFDPTLFVISAQPKEGVEPAKVENAIYGEIDKAQKQVVTDQELEKAKNILLANFYRQMKTISGKANAIGTYEVFFGDYTKLFTAAEQYKKVTKDDVMRVAKQYFTDRTRTVGTLIPTAEEQTAQPAQQEKQ